MRPSHLANKIFLLLMLTVLSSHAARRNLSEITYRFTNCASTNHDGPRVNNKCLPLYQEMDSPIVANDDSFFRFEDGSYDGAQGFRVPKDDLYNITIAGAAGGMGVCNYEFGYGGVVNVQVRLTTDYEYLILVGQRGTSVCDTNRTHIFCTNLPTNLDEASLCDENWETWTSSLPANNDTNFHYLRNGGGGGGGASMVWPRRRNNREFTNLPIAIGPGGGGASAILDYDYLANELVSLSSAFEIQYPNESDAMTINRYYINAHLQPFLSSSSWTPGARGIRPDGLNVVTSGSGGGWNPTLLLSLINVDGKLLSQRTDLAEGGFDCTSRIFSSQDRNVFRDVFGGYGGGGGGCGSGGAGGGYTGGHVLTNDNKNSGGGGDVGLFPNQIPNFRYNMSSTFHFNDGDGYVEIVSSDCTCAGWCIVYANESEFECFCPNGTSLAPDGSSCYEESNVTVNIEDPSVLSSGEESYTINELQFTNSSVNVLSLDVALSVQPLLDSTLPEEDVACAVVFTGSDSQIILASNPVRMGGGRADNLAELELDEVGDDAKEIIYTSLLDSPILVTGAFLFTNGNCSLIGPFQLNISTEDASTTAIDFSLFNGSQVTISARQILQIQVPDTPSTTVSTPGPDPAVNIGLVIGLVVVVGVLLFALIGIVVLLIVHRMIQVKRTKLKNVSTELLNPVGPVVPVAYTEVEVDFNNVHYEAVKDRNGTGVEIDHVTGNQYATVSIPGAHANDSRNPYATLNAGSGTYETPINMSGNQFTPRYGIISPAVDFTHYNRERTNSVVTEWVYPRSGLVYIRELGEGQFGKVLLMKAQDIAGYKGKIPVAVKTLTSRDPEVIQKFMEEGDLMKKFSHPNIVSLLGISEAQSDSDIDEDSSPLMILEYMPYGDLQTFLSSHRPNELGQTSISEKHFRGFAIDIARALEFLATMKYVHRDIAARNCLVGPNLLIKIADFGLSRGVYDKNYYKVAGKAVLPVRWMAPECLLFGIFSTASDVWAYGVVLWEISTYGETPLEDWEVQDIVNAAQKQRLEHTRPANCSDCFYDLMRLCHKHEADNRPSFGDILSALMDDGKLVSNEVDDKCSSVTKD